jgi:hypothetical protein
MSKYVLWKWWQLTTERQLYSELPTGINGHVQSLAWIGVSILWYRETSVGRLHLPLPGSVKSFPFLKWMLTLSDTSKLIYLKQKDVWRMPSSGMWRLVDIVWTDVSEERIASIFRVEKSASRWPQTKTAFFIVTAVKTSNLTKRRLLCIEVTLGSISCREATTLINLSSFFSVPPNKCLDS